MKHLLKPLRQFADQLQRAKEGIAFVEFALSLPIFMGLGMYGSEVAYLTLQRTNLEQVTVAIADNASRMGATLNDDIATTIFERDVNQLMIGTEIQGSSLDIFKNGRVIVSSLEQNDKGKQKIAWQRCRGILDEVSSYGLEGTNGSTTPKFKGMGKKNGVVTAPSRDAVMFVEVVYRYEPLFGSLFLGDNIRLHEEAAFNVRDNRDLDTGLRDDGTKSYKCNKFTED